MSGRKTEEIPICFYCGALVGRHDGQGDHFPIPKNQGGRVTVPCCSTCHDMKDRFPLEKWPAAWISKVIEDFPNLNRETRIFLAKAIRYFEEKRARK